MTEPTVDPIVPVKADDANGNPNVTPVTPVQTLDEQIALKVPDTYKDKGYVKNLVNEKGEVPAEKLFKEVDELQSLKGKKTVPFDYSKATPEEIMAHIESSRPESAKVYEVEGIDPSLKDDIQNMFYEKGVPPYIAKELVQNYLNIEKAQIEKLVSKEGFEQELKGSFGDKYEETAKTLADAMKSVQDEQDQKIMGTLKNSQLGAVYRLVNSLIKDYGVVVKDLKSGTGSGSIESISDLQKESTEAYTALTNLKKGQYTTEQHSAAVKRWQDAQTKLRELQGSK